MRRTNAEQKALHYTRHRERVLEQNRIWKRNNRLKVRASNRARKTALKNIEGSFTAADIELILSEQANKCPGCFEIMDKPTIDHFVPIARDGTNDRDNIQLMCQTCNCSKRHSLWHEWKMA